MKSYASFPDYEQSELPLRPELDLPISLARGHGYVAMAQVEFDKDHYPRSIELCERALEAFQQFGEEDTLAIAALTYSVIANSLAMDNGEYLHQAAMAAAQAVALYRQIEDSPRLTEMIHLEARYWFEAREYERALECQEGLLTEEEIEADDPGEASDIFDMGQTLVKLERWDEAREKFLQAREGFEAERPTNRVESCDAELEWLENIELLQQRQADRKGYEARRYDPQTPGYSRWMISRRIVELREMRVADYRERQKNRHPLPAEGTSERPPE